MYVYNEGMHLSTAALSIHRPFHKNSLWVEINAAENTGIFQKLKAGVTKVHKWSMLNKENN